jgi:transposase
VSELSFSVLPIEEALALAGLTALEGRTVVRSNNTPADILERAMDLYESGLSARQVSARLEDEGHYVSQETVSKTAIRRGISRPMYRRGSPQSLDYGGRRIRICGAYKLDEVVRLLNAYKRGGQPSTLSRTFKVPVSTIEKWVEKAGIGRNRKRAAVNRAERFHRKRTGRPLAELKLEAERLYREEGLSVMGVARRLGETYGSVYAWLRKRGVMRRRGKNLLQRTSRAHVAALSARAVSLYQTGLSSGEVAAVLGVKVNTVLGWVRRAGALRPPSGRLSPRRQRERRRQVWRLRGEGYSATRIAGELKMSTSTVRSILNDVPRGRSARDEDEPMPWDL